MSQRNDWQIICCIFASHKKGKIMKKSKKQENIENNEVVNNEEQQEIKNEEVVEESVDPKEQEIASLKEKCDNLNDKYIRLAAEYDNYRRRTAKERLDLIATASEDFVKGILPVLDDCERAIATIKDSDDTDAAKEGTELIYKKLLDFLKSKGVEKIAAKGVDFDTDYHEAVAQMPVQDKKQKNKVYDVVQEGYTLNGKVIRYAKVVVGC